MRLRLLPVLLLVQGSGATPPVPPPQTAAQRQLVAGWRAKAVAPSAAATQELLALLARPSMRAQLPPPLRSLGARTLLARIEAQLAVTEVVHQFKQHERL